MAAPISAIVLMVELTGGTAASLLVPGVLAVAGASLTARLLGGGSIYSARLPADAPGRAPGVAQAVNLAAADVPGYRALPPGTPTWNPQGGSSAACLRVSGIAPTAVKTSPEFGSQSGLSAGRLSSLTAAYRSAAAARPVLAALTSQRAAQCLQPSILGYLAPLAADSGLRLEPSCRSRPCRSASRATRMRSATGWRLPPSPAHPAARRSPSTRTCTAPSPVRC